MIHNKIHLIRPGCLRPSIASAESWPKTPIIHTASIVWRCTYHIYFDIAHIKLLYVLYIRWTYIEFLFHSQANTITLWPCNDCQHINFHTITQEVEVAKIPISWTPCVRREPVTTELGDQCLRPLHHRATYTGYTALWIMLLVQDQSLDLLTSSPTPFGGLKYNFVIF